MSYQPNHCFLRGTLVSTSANGNGYIIAILQDAIPQVCPESVFNVVIPPAIAEDFSNLKLEPGDQIIITNAMVYQFKAEYRFKLHNSQDITVISRYQAPKKIDLGLEKAEEKFITKIIDRI